MAHEIMENDNMFSVRVRPWHGLGDVLKDAPTVPDARKSYLTWSASLSPLQSLVTDSTGTQHTIDVKDKFAVVRDDTLQAIGVVGKRYRLYQNSQMWDFLDIFQKRTNCKLETAGSLRNGETTWVLAKDVEWEVIDGDPISEYFLIKNGFDGASPISVMMTNIRVVCNNTLSGALRAAKNVYNVRHVKSVDAYMKQVDVALGVRFKYQEVFKSQLGLLSGKSMITADMREILKDKIFIPEYQISQTVGVNTDGQADDAILSPSALTDRMQRSKEKRISRVLSLVEGGAGSNIKGVKGTAYGLFQAIVEWHDHEKSLRTGSRGSLESRFENAFITGGEFKNRAMLELLKAA
jgi:phage/plasmid-like protein (TIGR03299 family)